MFKEIMKFSGELSEDPMKLFDETVDFTLSYFQALGGFEITKTGNYSAKEQKALQELTKTLLVEYQQGIATDGWIDPLGECYEALTAKTKASQRGQFFTPSCLCKFMTEVTMDADNVPSNKTDCGAFGYRTLVSDPSCGSGRNLLAIASKFLDKPTKDVPYFIGEDIDDMCCKMTALNLMAHGVPGEVICHNTLTDVDTCKYGFVVNEGAYPLPGGFPTIRMFTDTNRFVLFRTRR